MRTLIHKDVAANYEKAFREYLEYGRFQGYDNFRRAEKTDLMKGVEILEIICAREKITEDSKIMISHLSVLAHKGYVSEGFLSITVDKVMEELQRGIV